MKTEYIDRLRKEYIENHTRKQERTELIRENKIEKRDIYGYHGREIFELIQNADDAFQKSIDENHKPDCNLEVLISYKENVLTVANSGTFFDEDGIRAIVEGNNSPKSGKYLGSKGTGFRSVLNWASVIKIFSGEFAVEFSEDIAKEEFDGIRHNDQIVRQLAKEPNLYIPMLSVPRNIFHDRPKDLTTIEVKINPDKLNDSFNVTRQLEEIDLKILLFLPNVSKIRIETDEKITVLERSYGKISFHGNIQETEVSLFKFRDGIKIVEEKYILFQKFLPELIGDGQLRKDVALAIGIPVSGELVSGNLYSYFPLLDTDCPFNCILHATYDLGDHRNTLIKNKNNRTVVKEQLAFIFEVSEVFITQGQFDRAYSLLRPVNLDTSDNSVKSWKFLSAFSSFGLEDYFLEKLKDSPIFQTVNNKLISVSELPKYINEIFPGVFRGDLFKNLIKYSENSDLAALLSLISAKYGIDLSYTPAELCEIINGIVPRLNIHQRVRVFIWWNRWVSKQNVKNILPQLLKDSRTQNHYQSKDSGQWVQAGKTYFLLEGDFESIKLPNWIKIASVNQEYQKDLVTLTKKEYKLKPRTEDGKRISIIRQICTEKIFSCIELKYRDRSNIIPFINSSVDGKYKRAIEFVKWLRRSNKTADSVADKSVYESLNFPTDFETVRNSRQLFFPPSYGNPLTACLFENLEGYEAFPSFEKFSIPESEKENFTNFIREFGVLDFPPVIKAKIEPISEYKELVKKLITESGVLTGFSSQELSEIEYQLSTIVGLETILSKASTETIIKWILSDAKLKEQLNPDKADVSDYRIDYRGKSQHNSRPYSGAVPNYIRFCFNTKDWLTLNGKRYAPCHILNGVEYRVNSKFNDYFPVISKNDIEGIALKAGTTYEKIVEIFSYFEFAKDVIHLNSDDFYGVLLRISEIESDRSFELYRSIYRLLEQSDSQFDFEDSDNKTKFLTAGKLLVRHNREYKLWKATECYLPSSKIVNTRNIPIVDKGQRTNSENFLNVFGCKTYNKDYKIVPGSQKLSVISNEFSKYLSNFIAYVRPFSERNVNIKEALDKLSISLVESIQIKTDNDIERVTEPYTLLRETGTRWYIVYNENGININQLSELIERIFENIANTPHFEISKIGELFRSSEETRKFLIQKEFRTLSVMEDWNRDNHIKDCFENTLKSFGFDSEKIDKYNINFSYFESLENIPSIISIFNEIGITTVEQFIEAGFVYNIDLKSYWKGKLREFIQQEQEHFSNVMYKRAVEDNALKEDFVRTINNFKNFVDHYDPGNPIEFDPEEILVKKFGQWKNVKTDVNARQRYHRNFETLNPDSLFSDEINNDPRAQTMIYFNLKSEFEAWVDRHKKLNTTKSATSPLDSYQEYKDKIPEKHTRTILSDNKERKSTGNKESDRKNFSSPGTFNSQKAQEKSDRQTVKGSIGELLVYNALCAEYGKENVFPRSEAFVKLGILKPGQATSGKFDLSYKNDKGEEIQVEVKTGSSDMFYMSTDELEYAKTIQSESETSKIKYRLFYVYDIDSDSPKYEILPDKFWEDSRYHYNEIIERIEFSFKVEK